MTGLPWAYDDRRKSRGKRDWSIGCGRSNVVIEKKKKKELPDETKGKSHLAVGPMEGGGKEPRGPQDGGRLGVANGTVKKVARSQGGGGGQKKVNILGSEPKLAPK